MNLRLRACESSLALLPTRTRRLHSIMGTIRHRFILARGAQLMMGVRWRRRAILSRRQSSMGFRMDAVGKGVYLYLRVGMVQGRETSAILMAIRTRFTQ